MERLTGTVKFYNTDKAFGFIKGDDGKEHFMHISGIEQNADGSASFSPQEGEVVSFTVEEGKKGPMATNIRQEAGANDMDMAA